MTRNQWIERAKAEDQALKMVMDHLIHFCFECFQADPTPPRNDEIKKIVNEAAQVYYDAIEDL